MELWNFQFKELLRGRCCFKIWSQWALCISFLFLNLPVWTDSWPGWDIHNSTRYVNKYIYIYILADTDLVGTYIYIYLFPIPFRYLMFFWFWLPIDLNKKNSLSGRGSWPGVLSSWGSQRGDGAGGWGWGWYTSGILPSKRSLICLKSLKKIRYLLYGSLWRFLATQKMEVSEFNFSIQVVVLCCITFPPTIMLKWRIYWRKGRDLFKQDVSAMIPKQDLLFKVHC